MTKIQKQQIRALWAKIEKKQKRAETKKQKTTCKKK